MPSLSQRPNWRARRGSVAFKPALLVDQVVNESALASHPDVLWYPSNDALDEMIPGDWWANQNGDPNWYSAPGAEIVAVPTYGMNAVRFGSPYDPDHYICATNPVSFSTFGGACTGAETIQSWRKWINSATPEQGGAVYIRATPLTECYLRWMILLEADVAIGMEEHAMKLSGLEPLLSTPFINARTTMGYKQPGFGGSAADRAQLTRYWASATLGEEDHAFFSPARYLILGQWHCIEQYAKLNSDPSLSDGAVRIWLDDELIYEDMAFKWFSHDLNGAVLQWGQVRGQLFHGGIGLAPSAEIHHRQFGYCLATRRIGAAKLI